MASIFVAMGGGDKDHHHHHSKVYPRNSFKKTWSTNPSPPVPPPPPPPPSCGDGHQHQVGGSLPKCVCAPATHAGSFKCRLHRVNSHVHSAPPAPPASSPDSSTRTVEAQ